MSFDKLSAALVRGKLPHALLFAGPENSGQKETIAKLAEALLGKAEGHPDLRLYGPEEDKRTIPIEEVRRLIAEAHLRPYQAPVKLFVIEHAEYLNEAAQSALLKTLEEPPAHTHIVLVTHAPERLLDTVRSRMQTVHFRPAAGTAVEIDEKAEKLKNALWERLAAGRAHRAPEIAALTREQALEAIGQTIHGVRESLLLRTGCAELASEDDRLRTQRLADNLDEDALIRRIETLAEFRQKIAENANTKLALSVLWEEL